MTPTLPFEVIIKRFFTFVVVVGLLLVVALLALRWYVRSHRVAQEVAEQVRSAYGAEVKVASVDVGIATSSVRGFELFEADAPPGAAPWLTVADLETDLSLLDLVRGNTRPGRLTVSGAKILLRFDRAGRLLTSFPRTAVQRSGGSTKFEPADVPEVRVEDSEVTLQKEGTDDLIVRHVDVQIARQDSQVKLTGSATALAWGAWDMDGNLASDGDRIELRLKSKGSVKVQEKMLRQLPFVPPAVFRQVRIARAESTAALTVGYQLSKNELHYRVDLEPSEADVHITSIDLDGTRAHGKVIIDDNLIELRGVEVQAYGGTVKGEADLDFRGKPMRLKFPRLEADRLQVARFPSEWGIPPQITGALVGKAALEVDIELRDPFTPPAVIETIGLISASPAALGRVAPLAGLIPPPAVVHTRGSGKAKIVDAKVAGNPTAAPIDLDLRPVRGGFRFGGGEQTDAIRTPRAAANPLLALAFIEPLLVGVQPAPAKSKDSTLDINLKLDKVDLAKFARDMKLKLDFPVSGLLSFQVKVGIPLDDSKDLKKYRFHGQARLDNLVIDALNVESAESEVDLAGGVLRLTKLTGRLPADPKASDAKVGSFAGTGSFQIEPMGELQLQLTLDRIPLSQVAKLSGMSEPLQGEVSGELQASVSGKDLKKPEAWRGGGRLSSRRVEAFGWSVVNVTTTLRLADGALSLDDGKATLEGAPISASARLRLTAPYTITARSLLNDVDLTSLQRLNPSIRPPFSMAGRFNTDAVIEGTLQPLKYAVSGQATFASLRIEKFLAQEGTFAWKLGGDLLKVDDLRAKLYAGEIAGSAAVPLGPSTAGSIGVRMTDLDAAALAKDVPKIPVKLEGRVGGELKGTLPPAKPGQSREAAVQLDLRAPKMRVQNIPTEQLQGNVDYKNGVLDYKLEGKSLGGTFELDGQIPPAGADAAPVRKGHLRIENVFLGGLLRSLHAGPNAEALRGRLSVAVDYSHTGPDGWPEGSGRFILSGVRYKDTVLVSSAEGGLMLSGGELRVRDFSTVYGQGTIRAQLAVDLRHRDRSWFNIEVENVEASHLLGPWLEEKIQGPVRARIRGKGGRGFAGSADIQMERGSVAGLSVTSLRLPITFHVYTATGRTVIESLDFTAEMGRGLASGRFSAIWDYLLRLDGQVKFARVDVKTLLQQTTGSSELGAGAMTGRFDFAGHDMRSLDDLSGKLDASFEQAQPSGIPILQQVVPYLGIGSNTTFQKGKVAARLDRGFFRIGQLSLEGANLKLFGEGMVSLAGRLDLAITANTASIGLDVPGGRLLRLRIPVFGPMPLQLAQQAANFLSNRVIHLEVTGTVRNPTVRVSPLATLSDEAVRFFFDRSVASSPLGP